MNEPIRMLPTSASLMPDTPVRQEFADYESPKLSWQADSQFPIPLVVFTEEQHRPLSLEWTTDLDRLKDQAREPDWDGEGADALNADSLELAHSLLARFPDAAAARDTGELVCELFPSPHGDVIFYWYDQAEKATLTIFAKPGREVSYSVNLPDEDMRGEIRNVHGRPGTLDMAFRKLLAVARVE